MQNPITIENIKAAAERLKGVVVHSPLQKSLNLSSRYNSEIWLKREDLQIVRSYKIRGAYNLMKTLTEEQLKKGVVCASAGNHAQGVAYSCFTMGVKGTIFMPNTTPKQKVNQVKMFGKEMVEVVLIGDTYDDAYAESMKYSTMHNKVFVHPFEDPRTIEGQGTIGAEILEDFNGKIDYIFLPVGGGGLASGLSTFVKKFSPDTKIIGVEPAGAPAMRESLNQGKVVVLDNIDKFVDGAAVKKVGDLNFEICRELLDDVVLVPEGKVCTTILSLYNEQAIVVEPAGALSISALDYYAEQIKGKNVVCVVSGSNNDIGRMEEIKERSLMYEGLKHYFIVSFPQRAGALREFLDEVLGPNDDITRFEYTKKNIKDAGPALVGIELKHKEDYELLLERMKRKKVDFIELNKNPTLFSYIL
jgi:threonine dehydratase